MSYNDAAWDQMLTRPDKGYTLSDPIPRTQAASMHAPRGYTGPPLYKPAPSPMLDQYVKQGWVGKGRDELLALPDWIPADARAHPRSYLVPRGQTAQAQRKDQWYKNNGQNIQKRALSSLQGSGTDDLSGDGRAPKRQFGQIPARLDMSAPSAMFSRSMPPPPPSPRAGNPTWMGLWWNPFEQTWCDKFSDGTKSVNHLATASTAAGSTATSMGGFSSPITAIPGLPARPTANYSAPGGHVNNSGTGSARHAPRHAPRTQHPLPAPVRSTSSARPAMDISAPQPIVDAWDSAATPHVFGSAPRAAMPQFTGMSSFLSAPGIGIQAPSSGELGNMDVDPPSTTEPQITTVSQGTIEAQPIIEPQPTESQTVIEPQATTTESEAKSDNESGNESGPEIDWDAMSAGGADNGDYGSIDLNF